MKQSVDLRDVREKERKTEERCWTGAGQVHQGITAFGEVGKEGGVEVVEWCDGPGAEACQMAERKELKTINSMHQLLHVL